MNPLGNLDKYNIILGSKSPRRKQLLEQLGIKFTIDTPQNLEENYPDTLPPEKVPEFLSQLKAEAYASEHLTNDMLLITADTVVISHGEVLGKPKSHDDAKRMLQLLSHDTHKVITGVTLLTAKRKITFSVTTKVVFETLTDSEIDYYINKYKPYDKAGAYGIQEWIGSIGVSSINGSFYNVMGLPLCRLYNELKSL